MSNSETSFYETVLLPGFRPEEIEVNVEGRLVRIHACWKSGDDLYEIRRTLCLPRHADAERVQSALKSDGRLVVRAPIRGNSAIRASSLKTVKSSAAQSVMETVRNPKTGQPCCLLIRVSAREFDAKDINVNIVRNGASLVVVVHADQLTLQVQDGQRLHRSLEFSASLPRGFDTDKLTANLRPDGWLELRLPALNVTRRVTVNDLGLTESD